MCFSFQFFHLLLTDSMPLQSETNFFCRDFHACAKYALEDRKFLWAASLTRDLRSFFSRLDHFESTFDLKNFRDSRDHLASEGSDFRIFSALTERRISFSFHFFATLCSRKHRREQPPSASG